IMVSLTAAYAGTTGKIAGKVVDANTGEPLPGANVIIEGTLLGASTDTDGDYYIINVPVGAYTLVVSYIGYRTVKYQGVRVILDQTTKVDFKLQEDIAEGETIVVTAETFKVQKDETSKKITIQAEEIQSMPVQDFSEMVAAQAGVVQIESSVRGIAGFEDRGIEEIHVRGGRSGEIGYTIDGMYIVNPFYGSKYSWTQLNDFAIEQVDMKTGVFDAEYGGAMSSMINMITRDGGVNYEGNIRIRSSNPANLARLFHNEVSPDEGPKLTFQEQDYLRDSREIAGGFGGPVPFTNKKVRFILTGHKEETAYNVFEFDKLTYNTDNEDDPQNDFLNELDTIAGWHEMGFRYGWDLYGKLTWNINNTMKLDFSSWNIKTTFRTANLSNRIYQFYEKGRNISTQTSDRQALMFNHQVSKNTFYNLRFSRFYQKMFIGVTDNGKLDGEYLNPGEYEEPWYDTDWENNPYFFEYYISGHDRYYHKNFAETYEGFVNILHQATKHHQLKMGGSYRYHTIFIDEQQLPWLNNPYIENYNKNPEEASIYLQDLIEYDYMTIRVGLRMDMLNANGKYWKDPYDEDNKRLVDTDWEYYLSPRLGFSHVITDNSTFTFGYGKFTQTPTYRNKYINDQKDIKTYSPLVGNSGLEMEKMTAYEFGLNVGITDDIITQVIGWSKEYSELTSTERIPQFPYSFTTFLNTDYATARGVDLVIRRRTRSSTMELQYTLSRATANRRDPWEGYRETDTPRTMPKREILMSYDRTHDISLRYSKRFMENTGPSVMNFHPLGKSTFNLMFLARSGFPYTPVVDNVPGQTNSERMPWNITANFLFRKYVSISNFDLIFGLMVQNVLDLKNPIAIWPETGKADDPGSRLNELIQQNFYSKSLFDQPYRYGRRRQIDFSLEIAF
ncbi:MAG: TonB-dependent receptor plug domain-containing protein, partial [Caldithrix sp.]|nr:TonB-dependent receptor plug domain-containing protein [Caldithrix sp.]